MSEVSTAQPMSESYRTGGSVGVKFDVNAGTPASATLDFRKKHAVSLESHGGIIRRLEIDPLAEEITKRMGQGSLNWNPHWVIVTQVYEVECFSSFISGARNSSATVIASGAQETKTFGLADPSLNLSVGNQSGMAHAVTGQRGALPYFVISKFKNIGDEIKLARYG